MKLRDVRGPASALFASALLLSAGCGKEKAAPPAQPAMVSDVKTVTVVSERREAYSELVGSVRARTIAPVAPQMMGRILSMPVAEGMRVAAGAVIAVIDDASVRAQLASAEGGVGEAESARDEAERAIGQAQSAADLARKSYDRYKQLFDGRVISPQEFDEVESRRTVAVKEYERALEKRAQALARIAQAKGQLRAVEAQRSWTRVTAPFSGVVVEKRAESGAMAMPGVPIVVLEDTGRYRIEAAVPETSLSRVRIGQRVEAVLDFAPGKTFPATVSEIVPSVDPGSRTFTVKADLSAPGLRTGLSGHLRLPAGQADVLAVPRAAVIERGGYESLFVVTKQNVARLTMVKTGAALGDRVEILSGIGPGDRVAVTRLDRLVDGASVEPGK
jgi:multidrug efflux system membrane fusion protein